ncbi:MAG: hypothetical protein DDT37_00976 [Firmicutes bacterium]|nr:hypothetical protein [candidate division NPL-UPA2 bacterium]
MGRLVYHHKKATGVTYVYEITGEYWDKERKQMRNKQVCIGKLDPETGELIPSKRRRSEELSSVAVTASTSVIGPTLLLDKIARETRLTKTLKYAFPEKWEQLVTLAFFLVCTGDALVHADAWCRNHHVPSTASHASQRVSELLQNITEDELQSFFKRWICEVSEKDLLCYDITSVSSYSELNEYVRYGYNRDGEPLPQVNLAMVYGQKTKLPVIFRVLPGSISDVSTITKLLEGFDKLDFPTMDLVMDRGFYSQSNITELFKRRYHFIIGVPSNRKWVREVIDGCQDALHSPRGYRQLDDTSLYMHTRQSQWPENGRRCYLHVFYNSHKAADDFEQLIKHLLICKNELDTDSLNKAHERDYEQYFIVKNTPVRGRQVEYNDKAIQAFRNRYAGFFAILTSRKMDAIEALAIYRNKDGIEKLFDDMKNHLDMKRLRVHNSGKMTARIFLQFIAAILLSQIHKTLREKSLSGRYSPRLLLGELESLTRIHYQGKYRDIITEASKSQREILDAFGINVNTL